jgi:hypothetical protein
MRPKLPERPSQSGLLQRSDLLRKVASTIVERFAPIYVIVDESGEIGRSFNKTSRAGRRSPGED